MHLVLSLFQHPAAEGARRVLLAALGHQKGPIGSFISAGKVVEPRFLAEAPRVLARVKEIYDREYLPS